ncbi:MAG: class I SAM-dependent methyltransferase [Weeksellaceae bacterium]|nr:class I SAM-dependent methyltransferase [Weeksellaceae bacterium]
MAWFETWFDTPYYHILYKDRDFAEAENFISLLLNALKLSGNSKIIDLGCGKGRHSVFLHKAGYSVLGLDLSKESIFHNKQFETSAATDKIQPSLKFEVHDMRNEIFPAISTEKADAVLNLFTSFGYFEDEREDRKVFQSVRNALNDRGYFVLDFLNETWVKNTLVPEYVQTKEGIDFHIKKRIENQHIIKDINFKDHGKDYHFYEKVKLHEAEEIESYGEEFGFELMHVYGDYHLGPFKRESSPRCINVFRKKTGIQNRER